jgi:hypothetical protein
MCYQISFDLKYHYMFKYYGIVLVLKKILYFQTVSYALVW